MPRFGWILCTFAWALSILTPASGLGLTAFASSDSMPRDGLPVDFRLRKNLAFWIDIYSKYESSQGVLHDSRYIDKIYAIVDLRRESVTQAKRHWREVLLSLHKKQGTQEPLTEDEKKIQLMYLDVQDPDKFLTAAHRRRLRLQHGQRDRFREGLVQSGRYLTHMEAIFRAEGLPVELTRLPFVESSFNTRARSKVGASGIWQFMRSTGRLFLSIDERVDERNDPIRATEAAAKLLKLNYSSLQSWPLAITAYNHGRKGMMRAVRTAGTDNLGELVTVHRNRSFGFASSNFYTELLAAIEVEREAEKYFPGLVREPPMRVFETPIPHFVNLKRLSGFLNLPLKEIVRLNPGLAPEVLAGKKLFPAGYRLRLPMQEGLDAEASARVFQDGYARIPSLYKLPAQAGRSYGRKLTASGE